jgi:hypothetical protein
MGGANVAAAYQIYAGKVPATSMQVLLYMALVSKDADPHPWFSKGREALAQLALGRPAPFDRADARAVERAVEPLLAIGAIETDRRASVRRDGSSTARYRLNLDPAHAPRKAVGVKGDRDPHRPTETVTHAPRKAVGVKGDRDPHRPTETVTHAPRIPSSRPTNSVLTPHEKRGAEEKEELSRSEIEEEMADLQTASHPLRATAPSEPAPVIALFPDGPNAPSEPAYRSPASWGRRRDFVTDNLDGASTRRAKAVADHQARLASGETT